MISYLPLSHIAAQMLDIYTPLQMGITMWFAQPDALKGSLVQTMKVCMYVGGLACPDHL